MLIYYNYLKMKSSLFVVAALLSGNSAVKIQNDDVYNLSQSLIDSNADIANSGQGDRSDNQFDTEIKTSFAQVDRDIIDKDGDGVEDNQKKSQDELDRFRAKVFGVAVEDMHNTHNGEYPGHVRAGESPMPIPAASIAQVNSTQKIAKTNSASASAAKALNADMLAQS